MDRVVWAACIVAYNAALCLFVLHIARRFTAQAQIDRPLLDRRFCCAGAMLVVIPLLTWASSLASNWAHYGVAISSFVSAGCVLAIVAGLRWGLRTTWRVSRQVTGGPRAWLGVRRTSSGVPSTLPGKLHARWQARH